MEEVGGGGGGEVVGLGWDGGRRDGREIEGEG